MIQLNSAVQVLRAERRPAGHLEVCSEENPYAIALNLNDLYS